MKKQWHKIICLGLALVTLSLSAIACPSIGSLGQTNVPDGQTEIPVVELNRVAPNNLDLAGKTMAELATPAEGALIMNEGLRLWVPPGAVAQDTPVTVKLCIEYPEIIPPPNADAPEGTIISELYDVGPDNTAFNIPVKISLPYYEESLPAGTDESTIRPIFFDGVGWAAIDAQVDTVNNIVNFETKSFPGFSLALLIPTLPASLPGVAVLAGVTYVAYRAWDYAYPAVKSQVIKDPIYYKKANNYITPYTSVVEKNAAMARIYLNGTDYEYVQVKDMMGDPEALAALAESGGGSILFYDGKALANPQYLTVEDPDDWLSPDDYFNNGMVGDCKNVANGMASIFRSYGYPVKCVDGLMNGKRHVWAEVVVDGKVYYVGEAGDMAPLDKAIADLKLTRPQGVDGQNQMWDEHGQQPYKENWWSKLQITVDTTLAFPGGEVSVEIFGAAGTASNVEVTLENSVKGKSPPYIGVTDAATGVLGLTWQLDEKAPTGMYTIIATNTDSHVSEVEIFNVVILTVSANIPSPQVFRGEDFDVNVRLNYPLETDVVIDNIDYSWPTDKDGFVLVILNAPETMELGTYTLTIRVPEFNIFTQKKYTVTVPSTMTISISPKQVAPGGTVTVKVNVQPPKITRITIRNYSGSWNTDKNGVVSIPLTVSKTAALQEYEIVVEAPDLKLPGSDLKLTASDKYTVVQTLGREIGLSDINVVAAELTINADGEDKNSYFTMRLTLGGQYARVDALNGNEIIATGSIPTYFGQGELYYSFTLNKDLTMVTSGTFSLLYDTGEFSEFSLSNVPMDNDYEDKFKAENGMDALAFSISGTAITGHYSNVSVNEPSYGTFSRYFAADDSEILIVLVVATDSQLNELLGE